MDPKKKSVKTPTKKQSKTPVKPKTPVKTPVKRSVKTPVKPSQDFLELKKRLAQLELQINEKKKKNSITVVHHNDDQHFNKNYDIEMNRRFMEKRKMCEPLDKTVRFGWKY